MNKQSAGKINPYIRPGFLPLLLILICLAGYVNSFTGPFIFDDTSSIEDNPHIKGLWPLHKAMSAPAQSTVAGRPIAALTLALNYFLSGYSVWSYHAFNLLIHILSALTLYGIVRRTLLTDRLKNRFANEAAPLALTIAAVWAAHPIQTESITYIIQRVESLMGLFYLLTLYTAIRAAQSHRPIIWSAVSIICCGLGMATKEVMVTAPVLVLLHDRTFSAGSFGKALRRRAGLYIGLAVTWIILIALIWSGPRSGTVGFSINIGPLDYALSQCSVILHYLRLCIWPTNLCLDYGWPAAKSAVDVLPQVLVVLGILAVMVWGLIRNYSFSFPLVWLFGILIPTSSFIPIADLAFEHRMYLSLAGVAALVVIAANALLERAVSTKTIRSGAAAVSAVVLVLVLTVETFSRNQDYQSTESIWRTVIARAPNNPRGHYNLATALSEKGHADKSIRYFQNALELKPDYFDAHNNFALALKAEGNFEEAIVHFHEALQLKPDLPQIYNNLGSTLQAQGKFDMAAEFFLQAIELKPDFHQAYYNMGITYKLDGKIDNAIAYYIKALDAKPDYADAHYNLANAFLSQGKTDDAITHYQKAISANPKFTEAHHNLANAFKSQGKFEKAVDSFSNALLISPGYVPSLNSLAWLLATCPDVQKRNPAAAIKIATRAAEITVYSDPTILDTLSAAYAVAGRLDEAIDTAQIALEIATAQQNQNLVNHIQRQIELYKKIKQ